MSNDNTALGEPVEPVNDSENELHGQPVKRWLFPEMKRGDCVMAAGSELKMFADGSVTFRSTVKTNSSFSGDYWRMNIALQDSSGNHLFHLPDWISVQMVEPRPGESAHWYRMDVDLGPGSFDLNFHSKLHIAIPSCGC